MRPEEKQRSFDRGGSIAVNLFLKPPGKDGMWKNGQYRDGFNVFCTNHGSAANEPGLRSRHLPPTVALCLASALDTIIGSAGGAGRTVTAWVEDSLDLLPAALEAEIREAEKRVHDLRRVQSALTGRY